MRVKVEADTDDAGAETLRRLHFDGRVVEVAENIDRWDGADHRYVKVRADDGDIYIVRRDDPTAAWELIMYQRAEAAATPAPTGDAWVVPKPMPATSSPVAPSPRITGLAWGRIELEGIGTFRDAKVFSGGAREWDWTETGTDHRPGIQPADIAELLAHGATTIILSQGMLGRLQVAPETLAGLAERGARTLVLPTRQAVELDNRLRGHERVAGLFHTTC